jgi:hypothetical protein
MYCFCKNNPARCVCWCVKPGPQRIAVANRLGLCCSFDPGPHSIHRGNCNGYRPAADHNCNPARCVLLDESRPHGSQLQPGPVCVLVRVTWPAADHNCNPARRVLLDESRIHGSQLQPGPVCVLVRETWPAADRSCNPARHVTLERPRPAFDPSRELQRVPARRGSQLQTGSGCVARSIHPREQRHRVPARSGSQLQPGSACDSRAPPARIRSIEGTATGTGPTRITTATRPGVCCSMNPGSMDHNCKPARAVLLDRFTHGSNAIEYRPAADHNCNPARRWESLTCIRSIEGTATGTGPMDHNCNPARRVLLDVLRLQIQSN